MYLFFAVLVSITAFKVNGDGVERDILFPYSSYEHFHDITRTHRYVRDCQPKEHGNLTHQTVKPRKISEEVELTSFLHGVNMFGHHAVIKDPARMFSVQEPVGGGCGVNATSTVSQTASQNGCFIATNAGYFTPEEPGYGTCLGNIIINSKIVQTTDIQNANFGIRQDGTIVVGYLSEDEVTDQSNPFVHLVTGVGWIIRDGKSYLDESQKAECRKIETTGNLDDFFSVIAARTLLGVDENGFIHLVTVDGKTRSRGINLTEAVKLLQSFGVTNAINLDGGGSTTFVVNSTVVNYGGDGDKTGILIPRHVSTIICVKKFSSEITPEHMESLSYCCNRNYLLVIGLTVIISLSCLLHVHFYTLYQHHRNKVRDLVTGQQKKEALQSLLQQANNELSSEFDSELDDMDDDNL